MASLYDALLPQGTKGLGGALQAASPLLTAMSQGLQSGQGALSQAGTGIAGMMALQDRKKAEEERKRDQAWQNEQRSWARNDRGWQREQRDWKREDRSQAASQRQEGNALVQGIFETAQSIGADPVDLATAISYETGGTFDPMQPGPTTQWGQHRGLIQFGEPQAQQYGADFTSPEAAARSQLGADGAIARYFKDRGYQPGMGLLDLYSTVNAGSPDRHGASDANNGGAPGTVADKVNDQMAGHRNNAERLFAGMGDMMSMGQPAGRSQMAEMGQQQAPQQAAVPMARLLQIMQHPGVNPTVKEALWQQYGPKEPRERNLQRFEAGDGNMYTFDPATGQAELLMEGQGEEGSTRTSIASSAILSTTCRRKAGRGRLAKARCRRPWFSAGMAIRSTFRAAQASTPSSRKESRRTTSTRRERGARWKLLSR